MMWPGSQVETLLPGVAGGEGAGNAGAASGKPR